MPSVLISVTAPYWPILKFLKTCAKYATSTVANATPANLPSGWLKRREAVIIHWPPERLFTGRPISVRRSSD